MLNSLVLLMLIFLIKTFFPTESGTFELVLKDLLKECKGLSKYDSTV